MEVLTNWQNIQWTKQEEIIIKWLLNNIFDILEYAITEYAVNNNRHILANYVFSEHAVNELNHEHAKNVMSIGGNDVQFVKEWFNVSPMHPFDKLEEDEQYIVIEEYVPVHAGLINDAFERPPTPPMPIVAVNPPPTPPMRSFSKRPLLVLDLDETLVHATSNPPSAKADRYLFQFGYYLQYRPFVKYFLTAMSELYDIGVWSSGTPEYVENVVAHLFPFKPVFVYGRDMCDFVKFKDGKYQYIKPLTKLAKFGYSMSRTLIIDDTRSKCVKNLENAIIPLPFRGNTYDHELLDLSHYLEWIRGVKDFTTRDHDKWKI